MNSVHARNLSSVSSTYVYACTYLIIIIYYVQSDYVKRTMTPVFAFALRAGAFYSVFYYFLRVLIDSYRLRFAYVNATPVYVEIIESRT